MMFIARLYTRSMSLCRAKVSEIEHAGHAYSSVGRRTLHTYVVGDAFMELYWSGSTLSWTMSQTYFITITLSDDTHGTSGCRYSLSAFRADHLFILKKSFIHWLSSWKLPSPIWLASCSKGGRCWFSDIQSVLSCPSTNCRDWLTLTRWCVYLGSFVSVISINMVIDNWWQFVHVSVVEMCYCHIIIITNWCTD